MLLTPMRRALREIVGDGPDGSGFDDPDPHPVALQQPAPLPTAQDATSRMQRGSRHICDVLSGYGEVDLPVRTGAVARLRQVQHDPGDAAFNPLGCKFPIAVLHFLQPSADNCQGIGEDSGMALGQLTGQAQVPPCGGAGQDRERRGRIGTPGEQRHGAEHLPGTNVAKGYLMSFRSNLGDADPAFEEHEERLGGVSLGEEWLARHERDLACPGRDLGERRRIEAGKYPGPREQIVPNLISLARHGASCLFWRKDGRPEAKENAAPSDPEAGSILYLVTENGARRKFVDCVTAQPVDCVYADEAVLAVYPEECIDCGLCEPGCPVHTIMPESDLTAPGWAQAMAMIRPRGRVSRARRPRGSAQRNGDPDKARLAPPASYRSDHEESLVDRPYGKQRGR